jgi:hypothetical protein
VVGPGDSQGVADLAALPGVDQGVIVAHQVEDPAADPRGEVQGGCWLAHRDVRGRQPAAVQDGRPADRELASGQVAQVAAGAEADHRDPLDRRLGVQPADARFGIVERLLAPEAVQVAETLLAAGRVALERAARRGIAVVELRGDREVAGRRQIIGDPADIRVHGEELMRDDHPGAGVLAGRASPGRGRQIGLHRGAVSDGEPDWFMRGGHAANLGTGLYW